MKRIVALFLALVMCLSLCGCSAIATRRIQRANDEYRASRDEVDRIQSELDRLNDLIDRAESGK